MVQTIGWIGLGAMGMPMAENLLRAGYGVVAWNRTASKTENLAGLGAKAAGSPREVAVTADITIFMLTDESATEEVLMGEQGWLAGVAKDRVLINMATVRPDYNRNLDEKLRQHGVLYLEAPVMGSVQPARLGKLIVLAAGAQDVLKSCACIFEVLGRKTLNCGETIGKASGLKLINNLLLGIFTNGLVEAVNLARSLELSVDLLFESLESGGLNCGLIGIKKAGLKHGDHAPQFSLANMAKDLGYATAVGHGAGARLPVGDRVLELFQEGLAGGLGDLDLIAIDRLYRKQ